MTGTHDKIRGLLLAALMVTSVFVGAVALAGTAAATNHSDDSWATGESRWAGQQLHYEGTQSNGIIELFEANSDDSIGDPVTQVNLDSNGNAVIDTSNLEGYYYITEENSGQVITTDANGVRSGTTSPSDRNSQAVLVRQQSLNVEFNDDTIQEDEDGVLNVDSNRASSDLYISSDEFDRDELEDLFENNGQTVTPVSGEDYIRVDGVQNVNEVLDVEFTHTNVEVEPGNYTFDFEVVDTGVTSSASIQLGEEGDAEATIVEDAYRQDRGDFLRFTIELENIDTNQATLAFGGEGVGYRSVAAVEDVNEDGVVNVTINTYYAGRLDVNEEASGTQLVWAAGGDDEVVAGSVERTTPSSGDSLTDVIEASSYNIRSYSGDYSTELTDTDDSNDPTEDDVSVAIIRERPDPSATTRVAPDASLSGYGDGPHTNGVDVGNTGAEELYEESAERAEIADGDNAVVQFDISGIYGFFQGESTFQTASTAGSTAERSMFLNITQTNRDINQEAKVIAYKDDDGGLDGSGVIPTDAGTAQNPDVYDVYTDAFRNRFFVVIDTDGEVGRLMDDVDDTYDIEAGDEYRATLTLDESNSLLGTSNQDEETSTDFSIVDASASFDEQSGVADFDGDGSADDGIVVPKSEDTSITGTSTLAPGSTLSYELESSEGEEVFFLAGTTEVQDDGSFALGVDLSNRSVGTTFEARITGPVETESNGVITTPASVSIEDQELSSSDQTVTVASATLSQGGFITIHDASLNDGDTIESVRGTSEYLEAGDHEDVEISLESDYEEDGTAIAMAHMDTNDNEEYDFVSSDGADDGPYSDANGDPVVDDASVTVETEQTTTEDPDTTTEEPTTEEPTTEDPTTEDPTTEEPDETTTETTGPGFGIVLALVALIGAALLAVRRRD